jgi:hypothetical protein
VFHGAGDEVDDTIDTSTQTASHVLGIERGVDPDAPLTKALTEANVVRLRTVMVWPDTTTGECSCPPPQSTWMVSELSRNLIFCTCGAMGLERTETDVDKRAVDVWAKRLEAVALTQKLPVGLGAVRTTEVDVVVTGAAQPVLEHNETEYVSGSDATEVPAIEAVNVRSPSGVSDAVVMVGVSARVVDQLKYPRLPYFVKPADDVSCSGSVLR